MSATYDETQSTINMLYTRLELLRVEHDEIAGFAGEQAEGARILERMDEVTAQIELLRSSLDPVESE